MSFLPAVAGVASRALPVMGKLAGALPALGGIARGIGAAFGGRRKQPGDGRAYPAVEGPQRPGWSPQMPSQMPSVTTPGFGGTRYGTRFGEGASNMYSMAQGAYNAGRNAYTGARESFRGGDIGGGINHIAQGIGQLGGYAGQMFNQGRSIFNQFRDFGQSMRGTFEGAGQAFRNRDFSGGFNQVGQAMDQMGGFARGARSGYSMANMFNRRRRNPGIV